MKKLLMIILLLGSSCQTVDQETPLSKGWNFLGARGFTSGILGAVEIITINNQV